MYVFQAETYCDSCGKAIQNDLIDSGMAPENYSDEYSYDSDDFPKGPFPNEETDSPDHCASRESCEGDSVDLREYGLPSNGELCGAEEYVIGELLSDGLTSEGVSYLAEMLNEKPRTAYQKALHDFWRLVFSDELGGI